MDRSRVNSIVQSNPHPHPHVLSPSHTVHVNGSTVNSSTVTSHSNDNVVEPLEDQIMFLCINLSKYSPNTRFVLLSFGALPGWHYGLFMTLIELLCFSVIAICERALLPTEDDVNGVLSHRATLRQHFYVGALMTWSRGLTNVSLEYLSYPTQVIFKSAKLLTVMIGSVWIMNKSYSKLEYSSAILLAVSAALFSLGDGQTNIKVVETEPTDATMSVNTIGVVIVTISLIFDSLHSNTQDKLVRQYHASTAEAMLYTNFYAAILVFIGTIASGQFFIAFDYCQAHPISWLLLSIRSFVIYFGVLCFITLVKSSGAVAATAVTTVRKIATIACSFVLFPKPLTMLHTVGCIAFMCSVGLSFLVVKQQQTNKQVKYGIVPQEDTDKRDSGQLLQMVVIDKNSNNMKTLRDKASKT